MWKSRLPLMFAAALFGVAAYAQPVDPPVEVRKVAACANFGAAQDLATTAAATVITVTPAYFTASQMVRAPGKTMAIPRARVASFKGGVPVPLCIHDKPNAPGYWRT